MISIVICSRGQDISSILKKNIAETIGIEYELIIIDNSNNKYSIFSAYNEGISQSKYSYLCFMHDDILFHTNNWGGKVLLHFEERPEVGCLGVLGGHYIPNKPAYWLDVPIVSGNYISNRNNLRKEQIKDKYFILRNKVDVVVCDGLWLCIPKKMFTNEHIKFDNETFEGFHMYDMDVCFQILQKGYVNCVISDVLIEHIEGEKNSMNKDFFSSKELFFEKWKSYLPKCIGVEENVFINDIIDKFLSLQEYNNIIINEKNRIVKSKAYRLGKTILKPFSWMKNYINHK